MDISMPDLNGIAAAKLIKQEFPPIHVLMQTVFKDYEWVFDSISTVLPGIF
jgi:DNA-binding NarL/FixJ family response regulator